MGKVARGKGRDEDALHRRNRYRSARPDFVALAEKHAVLQQLICKKRGFVDFRKPGATRIITSVLLEEDFALKVHLPEDNLCPVLANRLNYLHWIEDLLGAAAFAADGDIRGLDIGCGPSCVYALLGARLHPHWHFDCLDIDGDAIRVARENVDANNLQSRIRVFDSKQGSEDIGGSAILRLPDAADSPYAFTMCNPPFYAADSEIEQLRAAKKSSATTAQNETATASEKITVGGEFAFVKTMIEESAAMRDKVRWFTSMLGIKRNFFGIVQLLKGNSEIKQYKTTTFVQGRTSRWAVAWSYTEESFEGCIDAARALSSEKLDAKLDAKLAGVTGAMSLPSDTPSMRLWRGAGPATARSEPSYLFEVLWDAPRQCMGLRGYSIRDMAAWSEFCSAMKNILA